MNCSSNQLINTLALLCSHQGPDLVAKLAPHPSGSLNQPSHASRVQLPAPPDDCPAGQATAAAGVAAGDGHAPAVAAPADIGPLQWATTAADVICSAVAEVPPTTRSQPSTEKPGAAVFQKEAKKASTNPSRSPRHGLSHPTQQQQQHGSAGPPPKAPASPISQVVAAAHGSPSPADLQAAVLVGDAYYAAKSRLLSAEQVVLRLLNFQLLTPRPHAYLLNLARLLGASQAAVAAAMCLLNDACVYTQLLLEQPAEVLAVAAMQLALHLLQQQPLTPVPQGLMRLQMQWVQWVQWQQQQQQVEHDAKQEQRQQPAHDVKQEQQQQLQESEQQSNELLPPCSRPQLLQGGGLGPQKHAQPQEHQLPEFGQVHKQQQQQPDCGQVHWQQQQQQQQQVFRGSLGSVAEPGVAAGSGGEANPCTGGASDILVLTMPWVAALDIDQHQVAVVTRVLWQLVGKAWSLQ